MSSTRFFARALEKSKDLTTPLEVSEKKSTSNSSPTLHGNKHNAFFSRMLKESGSQSTGCAATSSDHSGNHDLDKKAVAPRNFRAGTVQPDQLLSSPELIPQATFAAGRRIPQAGMNAIQSATRIAGSLNDSLNALRNLSQAADPHAVESKLQQLERTAQEYQKELDGVKRQEALDVVREGRGLLKILLDELAVWRSQHPDTSPVRIDNKAALDHRSRHLHHSTPVLLAYTVALAGRVYRGASQRNANFLLKGLKLFGYSLTQLAGEPNILQQAALSAIPETIDTLERRLDLNISTIPYAVCPSCANTEPPSYPNGSTQPVYPETCSLSTGLTPLCGAELLNNGKPIKTFDYHPFFEWFGRFVAMPGVRRYAEEFCHEIDQNPTTPRDKKRTSDGGIYRTLRSYDGKLFIADRGNEGRWFFILLGDFFNIEGNLHGGKVKSTGMLAMVCQNLPWAIRYDPAYVYMPGIIKGPHEPNGPEAQHQHYLRPLFEDLRSAYIRGTSAPPYSQTDRVAIAGTVMDFKASRPFAGLMDVTAHVFCFIFECWKPLDSAELNKGAALWRAATSIQARKIIEMTYGTRDSAFRLLPYWSPSQQVTVDVMHTYFLIILQAFFRDALRLENPLSRKKPKNKTNAPVSTVAHFYKFFPPPSLASVRASCHYPLTPDDSPSEIRVQPLDWDHLTPHVQAKLLASFHDKKWDALLFVCLDLLVVPGEIGDAPIAKKTVTRKNLGHALVHWRILCLATFPIHPSTATFQLPLLTQKGSAPIECATCNGKIWTGRKLAYDSTIWQRRCIIRPLKELDIFIPSCAFPYGTPSEAFGELANKLRPFNKFSLLYVYIDISNRAPVSGDEDEVDKEDLVPHLISWRRGKPLKPLVWTAVDSPGALARLHECLHEVITPSWVAVPPYETGLPRAGTLKADHWRIIFTIYLPLALLSLWHQESPVAADDASEMASVLKTSMFLTCTTSLLQKRTLTEGQQRTAKECYRGHVVGLKENFPGWNRPSHHLGEFEGTLLNSYYKAALFRQWLNSSGDVPLLNFCRSILDKAFGYSDQQQDEDENATEFDGSMDADDQPISSSESSEPAKKFIAIPHALSEFIKADDAWEMLSRYPGTDGFYSNPNVPGKGNSFVCWHPSGNRSSEWVVGQIQHIFKQNGRVRFAVKRNKELSHVRDPFKDFWAEGFEAKTVSDKYHGLEVIEKKWVLGHVARWDLFR
ncbi:hypothetical protein BDZ89DRAFT_1037146 [Hymenopellis radicata]|nr:hypothetical protein BDZ89DRAFT_1037146 [Hymenopellis radicata]